MSRLWPCVSLPWDAMAVRTPVAIPRQPQRNFHECPMAVPWLFINAHHTLKTRASTPTRSTGANARLQDPWPSIQLPAHRADQPKLAKKNSLTSTWQKKIRVTPFLPCDLELLHSPIFAIWMLSGMISYVAPKHPLNIFRPWGTKWFVRVW